MNRHIVLLLWTERGTSKRRSLPVFLAYRSLFSPLVVTQHSGWHPTSTAEQTTTALVPISQPEPPPPIVESTIVIDPPLPDQDEEPEPITNIVARPRRRVSFLILTFSLILLLSTGMYFLLPLLFPSATVTLVPMQKKLTTTATIHIAAQTSQRTTDQIPGRMLPSLTLSQAETVKTTGIGQQAATYAYGTITLYNGLLASQTTGAGTVLTGTDGIQIITDQTAFIPAASPPYEGQATILAHAIVPGSRGNIAAYDVNSAISSTILAKNTSAFYGGKDARTYPMVNQSDIDNAVKHLKPSLTQSIQGAFSMQLVPGEALLTPTCVLKSGADHAAGEEAREVQVSVSETCQAAAYKSDDLQQLVSHLVNQEARERYGIGYGLSGDMNISLASSAITNTNSQIATFTVNAASQWVYQVGKSQQDRISRQIAGKSKQQALSMLYHLQGIQQVSLSLHGGYNDTLPQDTGRIQIIVIYRFL